MKQRKLKNKMYTLKSLIEHCNTTSTNINGKWVPSRPVDGPFIWRVKDAWKVLKGKADAFTWPEEQ